MGDLTEQLNKQLAHDLGIEIPEKDAKEYEQLKEQPRTVRLKFEG